jgi:TRAP-type C4-dicarboxylate transport system substrate-binding protein
VIPAMGAPGLAFLASNIADYYKIFAPNTPFYNEANTEAAKAGLEILPVSASSPGTGGVIFKTKTPVDSLLSLKGQKVRVPGGGAIATELSELGAQPITLTTTETAPAIQAGTVNAAMGTASFAAGALKGLVGGYLDSGTFQVGPYFIFASKKTWDSLPAADQQGLASAAQTLVSSWLVKISAEQASAEAGLKSSGLWVDTISASEATTLAAKFQSSAWPSFQKTDPAAYAALMATRTQLGIS